MSTPMQVGIPPGSVMMQIINGKCVSRCVSLAAELAIADMLADGPRHVEALATATKTCPDALYRVLRLLAGVGVFHELPNKRFQNSPLSETLISNSVGSVRHYACWFGRELHWGMWSGLEYSVRTGKPWALKDHPDKTPFEVLAKHPSDQAAFNDAMAGLSAADGPAIVQAYDFSRFGRIVDVGGGHGMLAELIAEKAPHAKVTAFDLPHVIEGTRERLSREGLSGRIDLASGSFLDGVPGPADLCVLKHILHDWDDGSARQILANCLAALSDGGRVLICEMVVAPGPEGVPALVLDIEMLVGVGGRERTKSEFSELLAAAGLRLERIISTRTPIQLLEAVRTN